jgi:hypothetical protein
MPGRIWLRGKKPGLAGGPEVVAGDCVEPDGGSAAAGEDWAGKKAEEVRANVKPARRARVGKPLVPFGRVSTSIRVRQKGRDYGTAGLRD